MKIMNALIFSSKHEIPLEPHHFLPLRHENLRLGPHDFLKLLVCIIVVRNTAGLCVGGGLLFISDCLDLK